MKVSPERATSSVSVLTHVTCENIVSYCMYFMIHISIALDEC